MKLFLEIVHRIYISNLINGRYCNVNDTRHGRMSTGTANLTLSRTVQLYSVVLKLQWS
jgi:hypothetical protein